MYKHEEPRYHKGEIQMEHTPSTTQKTIIDVREIAPRNRHPLIFETFEQLEPGAAFILVNDHEPKPLYYQFAFEMENQFTWEYLEEGPDVWRVQIGKKEAV
jgi:uncharacterized protein (DUF2249 family)